jgi:hypothetical protein
MEDDPCTNECQDIKIMRITNWNRVGPVICCFLIIALFKKAVIRKINNKEIIETTVEIISFQ